MPPTGKLARDLRGDNWGEGSTEYLLAVLVEQVDALSRITLKANGVKRHLEPLHVPRPGEQQETAPVSLGAILKRGD